MKYILIFFPRLRLRPQLCGTHECRELTLTSRDEAQGCLWAVTTVDPQGVSTYFITFLSNNVDASSSCVVLIIIKPIVWNGWGNYMCMYKCTQTHSNYCLHMSLIDFSSLHTSIAVHLFLQTDRLRQGPEGWSRLLFPSGEIWEVPFSNFQHTLVDFASCPQCCLSGSKRWYCHDWWR